MTPDELAAQPRSPFDDLLALEFVELTPDRVVARLEVDPARHVQPYGIVHGGVYCAMAETTASLGAVLARGDEPGAGAVGQSNHTDFLRATRAGTLTAAATPVHVGRQVQLWSVAITDDAGALVATSKVRMFNVGVDRVRSGPAG
jgi:1,4-dihydroxy-2-naphthoyl-CoA hydrolase